MNLLAPGAGLEPGSTNRIKENRAVAVPGTALRIALENQVGPESAASAARAVKREAGSALLAFGPVPFALGSDELVETTAWLLGGGLALGFLAVLVVLAAAAAGWRSR